MDKFGILTESLGIKPQGKLAPMAASKQPTTTTDTTKSAQNSNFGNGSFLDDDFGIFRSSSNPKSQNLENSGGYGDVFGGLMKNSMQGNGYSFDYDPIFKNLNDSGSKTSSMPNYNKNVYDNDDIFGVPPGLKTSSSSVKNDDVFAPFTSAPKQSGDTIDDLLGNIGGSKSRTTALGRKESGEIGKKLNGFDDLIPGFGGRSAPDNRKKVETLGSRQSTTVHSTKSASSLLEDPFIVLESTSTPANASSGVFSDPLEELSQLNNTGRTKVSPSTGVVYDNMDPFDVFASSVPTNGSQSRNGSTMKTQHKYSGREKADDFFMKTFHNHTQKVDTSSRSEDTLKTADDARISIPKIPPFKQPTNGSPPLRPPPVKPLQADSVKSSVVSTIDELEEFAMGRVRNNSAASATTLKDATERLEVKFKHATELRERRGKASSDKETPKAEKDSKANNEDDLESFFGTSLRSRSAPKSRDSTTDSMLNTHFHNGGTKVGQRTYSGTSSSNKKAPPVINIVDDLSSFFGAGLSGGQFEEVKGESEERRRARLGRHCRTNDRMAQAVADMTQRDLQIQREQKEKHRISQTRDGEIKRWAAGKEGNLRALLSSLQYVLWTESGWQAVSLTDIITSASVKKVYRKATLCIHPDKVQQKGANLEQKYVAEKVFDILKEAWNKFNTEELS